MIRPFGVRDSLSLRKLQLASVSLDPKNAMLWPMTPLPLALACWLLREQAGAPTFVLDSSGQPRNLAGFVQACPRASSVEWDLRYLAPSLDEDAGTAEVWCSLLTHLVRRAGERGAQRLYARLGEGPRAAAVFRRIGFTVYDQETVYRVDGTRSSCASNEAWEPFRPRHEWAVNQLYARATPRLVRQAEPDRLQDRAPTVPKLSGSLGEEGHVLAHLGEVLAYVGVTGGSRGVWVQSLFPPDAGELVADVVSCGLSLALGWAGLPVYWAVRAHQGALGLALTEAGLQPLVMYSLLVKQTVVWVRQESAKLVPRLEKGVRATPNVTPIGALGPSDVREGAEAQC